MWNKLVRLANQILAMLLIVGLAPLVAHAHLPAGIEIAVSQTKSKFNVDDEILLEVSYTNVSTDAVRVLLWDTVLNGRIDVDIFEIGFEGAKLPYNGRVFKRNMPTGGDYIEMQPGEVRKATVDVLSAYDVNYQGEYSLSLKTAIRAQMAKLAPVSFSLKQDRLILLKRAPQFRSCTASRTSEIDSALSAAENLARIARDDLSVAPVAQRVSAVRYREWFGSYTAARWNVVQDHFNRIYSALSGQVLTFICDDTTPAFAYVFPSQPYEVYLGQAFWQARLTGTDSKAGTIIHELSHFTVLGGTDDHVYGQSGARSLARNNTAQAISNADSHEYFAENTPFLSMPAQDLAVSTIDIRPKLRVGATSAMTGTISNVGKGESTATQVALKVTGSQPVELARAAIDAIAQGDSFDFTLNFTAPAEEGEYTLELCLIDADLNPANNCSSVAGVIVGKGILLTPILPLLLED